MNDYLLSQVAEPVSEPQQPDADPPKRILVVDDDGDIRRLNAEALMLLGFEVDAAEDGSVAWDNIQENSYDLMITDNRMPKVTGVELLKKMRAARMALPVIMATGVLPQDEFKRYPWLQPAATLVKPYTLVDLLGKVKEVLRANEIADGQIAPMPDLQSKASANRLQS